MSDSGFNIITHADESGSNGLLCGLAKIKLNHGLLLMRLSSQNYPGKLQRIHPKA